MPMLDHSVQLKKSHKSKAQKNLVAGFNPFEKYESKWWNKKSPMFRGEHKEYFKPPPRFPQILVGAAFTGSQENQDQG